MSIIKRLDTTIANKIAAGEVIEKIANVIKELVENSIDATADRIDIELVESGLTQMVVTDNGFGMDETDALLAFERHATSKISNINDLFRINSLGFRGEALPSIAAVSRVEMVTSTGKEGVKVIYEDGRFIEKTSASANRGTKISVSHLFYTTPARFKYLKSPQYELALIVQLVNRYALAYPNISFRLVNDHKLQFVSPGNNSVIDILANIYTKDVARQMIAFSGKNRDYEISGYTSNPILNRSSSNYVHLFVNQRQIIDTKIINVIRECYEQLIPKNRYPIAVLYINCDPSIIDVNIHPRKQEIKFSEYQKLLDLIRATLEPKLKHTPIFQTPEKEVVDQLKMTFSEEEKSYSAHSQTEETPVQKHQTTSYQTFEKTEKRIPDMEYIGQFYGTYLIFQNEEGLYLLDQHAAAERIRYERYLANMAKRHPESQKLVVPMILTLSKDLLLEISDRLNELAEYGLVTDIEGNSLCISQIPAWFYPGYELIYAEEMVMTLANETSLAKKQVIDDLAKLLACKHSLKANHYVTKEEANHLLEDLRKCEKPYTCPHGRPIIVNFSLATIERWFNRVI